MCIRDSGQIAKNIRSAPMEDVVSVIRVACIGDSITESKSLGDKAYPTQLASLLGEGFDVRNFGVLGRTMCKKGEYPYWNEQKFEDAKSFLPHIVIIILGTNDASRPTRPFSAEFIQDYSEFVNVFKELNPTPKIYVGIPPPAFKDAYSMSAEFLRETIIPMIKQVATNEKLELLDFYEDLIEHPDFFVDGIHPNGDGLRVIAEHVNKVIRDYVNRKD
eukprot:TRINITY_DN10644_c0_g1_i2.p1 TRINITY_DN10644_c0_g1~~TRINITY_DN10644_c0_g1_i2.p1  ORF type:complete len:218 (+),score=28.09 TRINITY_DN10644_c0_g1_i2:64-717(+)